MDCGVASFDTLPDFARQLLRMLCCGAVTYVAPGLRIGERGGQNIDVARSKGGARPREVCLTDSHHVGVEGRQ